jgi:hypothetical protein
MCTNISRRFGKGHTRYKQKFLGQQRGYTITAKSNIAMPLKQIMLHTRLRFMFEPDIKATYQKKNESSEYLQVF